MRGRCVIGTEPFGAVVFVLSDSVGETGDLLVRAAAVQFDKARIEIRRKNHINSADEIEGALQQAREAGAMVAYTIVSRALSGYIRLRVEELGLISVDLLNPLLSSLGSLTGQEPLCRPGLNRKVDEAYFSKVAAIEFAVKFDDGKDPRGLLKADMVVTGVSRTSKTPLCMYLAYQGVKAANVPLVIESPPPGELFKLPAGKVVGLRINPEKLREIRKQRLKIMGLPPGADYASMDKLLEECGYAASIMNRLGCPVIDVTDKAVEETAANIMELYRKRKG